MARRIDIQIKARDDASAQLERIGGGVDRLTGKLDNLRNIAIAGVGLVELKKYIDGSLTAFGQFETASNRLNYALGNLGKGASTANMQQFAKSMTEVTAVSDKATMKIMTMAATMGHLSDDALKKSTVAAIGLSKAYGIDLEQAMKLIIESSHGQTSGLRALGIEIEKNAGAQKAFNVALDQGVKHFAAAQGELNTYEGKMEQLHNRLEMTRRAMGEQLAPVLMKVADIVLDYGIPAMESYQLVWEATSATATAEALKTRDIINHVFRDEAPKAVEEFATKARAALTGALEIKFPDLKGVLGQIPGMGGGAASQPAGGGGFISTIPEPDVIGSSGAKHGFRMGDYDPTGGFSEWAESGKFLKDAVSGNVRSAWKNIKRSYGRNRSMVDAGMGDDARDLYSASSKIGASITGALVFSGGSATAATVSAIAALGGWAIDSAGGAPTGTGAATMLGTQVGTKAGFNAGLFGGFSNATRAALFRGSATPGTLGRAVGTGGIVGLLAALGGYGEYRWLESDPASQPSPFVPPTSGIAHIQAALGTLPVAGIVPDQWSPDTQAAIARRGELSGRLQNLFANARERRERFLAEINGFGPQQPPGGGAMAGMWESPVGGREFRFGGGNAGVRLAGDGASAPGAEMVSYQKRMADHLEAQRSEYRKAERRQWLDRKTWGKTLPSYNYITQGFRM